MKRSRSQSGFTLLELLAASAIAAVALMGALSILGLLSRDRLRAAVTAPREGQELALSFQQDLVNARTVLGPIDKTPLHVIGFDAAGADSQPGSGRPVEIVYEIAKTGAGSLLVRRQRYLDEPSSQRWVSEAVAFDVQAMALSFPDEEPTTAPNAALTAATGVRLDRSVTVILTRSDGSTSAYTIQRY